MSGNRPILPRPAGAGNPAAPVPTFSSGTGSSSSGSQVLQPKRELIKVACDSCRAKKVKCDGRRPVCTRCADRRSSCHYESYSIHETRSQILKRHLEEATSETSAHERAIRALAQLPEKESLEHLRRLRADNNASITQILSDGHKASAAVASTSDSRTLGWADAEPSDTHMLRSVIPYDRGDIEFELSVRHPIAYPVFLTAQTKILNTETLLKPTRAGRLPFDPVHDRASPESQAEHSEGRRQPHGPSNSHSSRLSALLRGRAESLNISRWTNVPIDDDAAMRVLSLYFEVDHQIQPVLHEELFLRGFIEGKTEFCTKFLVSALLSWACQIYATRSSNTAASGVAFFHEAQSFVDSESELDALTSMSAFAFLSMAALSYARDDLSLTYLEMGARIGTELGLFNVPVDSEKNEWWRSVSPDTLTAARHVSWGVFNWLCLRGLHHHAAVIKGPPSLPLPGEDIMRLGKQVSQGPAQYLGTMVFRASCQLWLIFMDVLCVYYDGQVPAIQPGSDDYAEGKYLELLQWADNLPLDLAWGTDSSFEVLMLHIYFHSIVLHLFQPPIQKAQLPATLRSFEAQNSSTVSAHAASSQQLRWLILAYRIHHNEEGTLSILWHTGLVYLANSSLQGEGTGQKDSAERRFYFLLCIAGLEDLYVSFKVFGPITRGLLAMALEQGAINGEEAARLERNLRLAEPRHAAVDELINGPQLVHWIVNLDLAREDPRAAQGSSLAEQFTKLMVKEYGDSAPMEGSAPT